MFEATEKTNIRLRQIETRTPLCKLDFLVQRTDTALAGRKTEFVQYINKPSSIQRVTNTTDLKTKFSLGVRVQRAVASGIVTQDRSVLFIAMAPWNHGRRQRRNRVNGRLRFDAFLFPISFYLTSLSHYVVLPKHLTWYTNWSINNRKQRGGHKMNWKAKVKGKL